MKRVMLLLVAAIGFATAQAQVKYGVKGGLNASGVWGEDTKDSKAQVGFHAGAFAEISLFKKISLQPEVQFSLQGATSKDARRT